MDKIHTVQQNLTINKYNSPLQAAADRGKGFLFKPSSFKSASLYSSSSSSSLSFMQIPFRLRSAGCIASATVLYDSVEYDGTSWGNSPCEAAVNLSIGDEPAAQNKLNKATYHWISSFNNHVHAKIQIQMNRTKRTTKTSEVVMLCICTKQLFRR
ncbi:conserved hypothetical protein [Trichinella spiralis]|uniref:hypothetical protein n=1 Tax=Trichinella spiralis TaxID=6334 RepID=UPI0001EFC96D|nr:conserved hypothetical protein [Trichinella spiralis]